MKFLVYVTEEVSTVLYVEAKDREDLYKWLEDNRDDAVSFHTDRQEVHERDDDIEEVVDDWLEDFDTKSSAKDQEKENKKK